MADIQPQPHPVLLRLSAMIPRFNLPFRQFRLIRSLGQQRVMSVTLRVGRTLRDRVIFGDCRPLLGELPGRRVLSHKSGHRNRRLVIPIKVELVGHLFDHRPDDHHIEDRQNSFPRP